MKFFKIIFICVIMTFLIGCRQDFSSSAPFTIESAVTESEYSKENSEIEIDDCSSKDDNVANENSEEIIRTTTENSTIKITQTTKVELSTVESEKTTTLITTTKATTTDKTTTTTIETTTEPNREYIVFKPSTHYFHRTSCRWFDDTCIFDWDAGVIFGRNCTECKPEVQIVNHYAKPASEKNKSLPVTQAEFYMLANLVAHEYGAYWVPTAEKAKVVMTVMNRVESSKYPNSIKSVILQKNQYCWVPDSYYWKRTTKDCKDAVIYYFNHRDQYSKNLFSFWGDGRKNHFY